MLSRWQYVESTLTVNLHHLSRQRTVNVLSMYCQRTVNILSILLFAWPCNRFIWSLKKTELSISPDLGHWRSPPHCYVRISSKDLQFSSSTLPHPSLNEISKQYFQRHGGLRLKKSLTKDFQKMRQLQKRNSFGTDKVLPTIRQTLPFSGVFHHFPSIYRGRQTKNS
jgi:hypothetical protein